jgi:hypothetical protein
MGPGSEQAAKDSWADPDGPGRCPRCHLWLDGQHSCLWTVWTVRHRERAEEPFAMVEMCAECTDEMLAAWRGRPAA